MSNSEKQPGWGGFLGGCLLIIAVVSAGVYGFMWASKKGQEKIDRLQSEVFQPYWTAISEEDFEKAVGYRSEGWNKEHSADELRQTYQEIGEKYGPLVNGTVLTANGATRPGQVGEMMMVKTRVEFQNGHSAIVNNEITRADESKPWKIDMSAARQQDVI